MMLYNGEAYTGDAVLCRGLYDKLWQMTEGRVTIANAGEPFRAVAHRSLTGRVQLTVAESGEYYCIACPFCHDTRKRLWINHMYGQPGQDGWAMKFLAVCYNENCLSNPTHRSQLYDWVYGFQNANVRASHTFAVREVELDDSPLNQEASPPGLVLPLTDLLAVNPNHPALIYMLYNRGYTPEMLQAWNVGYCSEAQQRFMPATNRIIFPCWFNGKYVGWQGRYVGELSDWRSVAKYYTMPGLKKQRMLYNFDRAITQTSAVIVEGLTDVHMVGAAGMATMGATISSVQAQLLAVNFAGKPIILLYDPEAVEETSRAMSRLMASCTQSPVIDVHLPIGTDPGSTDHNTIWRHIITQASARGVTVTQCDRY